MRISRIKYKNFRNFKNEGQIDLPTDGSVSIIYGPNGVGKTTLHQLFQWIFYGEVHFNKTASKKMYNLEFEQNIPYGSHFTVDGTIDFEQPNTEGKIEYYSIRRIWYYEKGISDSKNTHKELRMLKKVGDDWKPFKEDPQELIDQFLPSGLSQYFFFDGESMIADLNQKGRDSAKSLRKALYTIFDLNIYEQAIAHIGSVSTQSTVLGQLNFERSKNCTDADVKNAALLMKRDQNRIDDLNIDIEEAEKKHAEYEEHAKNLSERIGGAKPRAALEKQRENNKNMIKTLNGTIDREVRSFGKDVVNQYPYLFLSRIVDQAQYRISLKVEDDKLLPGLDKELLMFLKEESQCICGNKIGEAEIQNFDAWLKKFPPFSYKHVYDQFKASAARWSSDCNPEELLAHMDAIFECRDQIDDLLQAIRDIDEELKNGTDADQLIFDRLEAERQASYWEKKRDDKFQELGVQKKFLTQRINKYNELVNALNFNRRIEIQMQIMEDVLKYFEDTLHNSAEMYSLKLGEAIQELLNQMLTSVRKVEMTSAFQLSVKDSFNDEAKSEGQFAVVSFAYIGGIFKLLSEVPELKGKEFPLVLDGPFSKLDVIQRQNVIDTIPSYAPQIILFSKDDLSSCFDGSIDEHVWTIYSNDERNVSYVKKGYDKEVFVLNEI